MPDFSLMHWYVAMAGPWTEAAAKEFHEGGYDGLVLLPDETWQPADLRFLHELAGLRSFDLTWPVTDDVAAFQLPRLESLTLATHSDRPVPPVEQLRLRSALLSDRSGICVGRLWPNLTALRVIDWRGTDLGMLAGARAVTQLHLRGNGQSGNLDGLQHCSHLERLVTINYSLAGSAPLRGLTGLREIRLLAAAPTEPHRVIDLADVIGPSLTTLWIANAARLENLDALIDSAVSELHLIDCELSPAEREMLSLVS
ncbi:hypothetical protein [Actinoplanes sp. NPDC051411]|uniref:hypothetical protein n=1 Tax=Actinoplanes sp. NPDC051411 TaxID=3155522 RepID=UPI0034310015